MQTYIQPPHKHTNTHAHTLNSSSSRPHFFPFIRPPSSFEKHTHKTQTHINTHTYTHAHAYTQTHKHTYAHTLIHTIHRPRIHTHAHTKKISTHTDTHKHKHTHGNKQTTPQTYTHKYTLTHILHFSSSHPHFA